MTRPPVGANEEQLSRIFTMTQQIEIPRFQRTYAWGIEEYSAFWEDILHTHQESSTQVHFLGAMVFARRTDRPSLLVLDGQQRLTSLMLLAAAMEKTAKSLDGTEANLLPKRIARLLQVNVTIDRRTTELGRLESNWQDREAFSELLSVGEVKDVRHDSHRLMQKAYEYFLGELANLISTADDPLEELDTLLSTILDQLWYIHIVCEEDVNAQAVFESLNARGEDLSSADLMKNFLFMTIEQGGGEKEVQRADELWRQMVERLGKDSRLPEYVHVFWTSTRGYVRADEIHRQLKSYVSTKHKIAWDFLKQLVREAEVYSELRNSTDEFWRSKSTARMLREQKTLNIRVTNGLLMALWSVLQDNPQAFEEWVRKVLNFMIRYSKVAEHPTNSIAADLSKWSIDIRSGDMSLDDLELSLKAKAPSKGVFIENFKSLKIKSGPTARLILMKISNALNEGGEPEALIVDSEKVTLEHVIPQHPDAEWKTYLDAHGILLSDVVDRVGNLTLLTGPKNSSLSNRGFVYKRDNAYVVSSLPITQHLVHAESVADNDGIVSATTGPLLEEFGLHEINQRQERLARIAERIFSLD